MNGLLNKLNEDFRIQLDESKLAYNKKNVSGSYVHPNMDDYDNEKYNGDASDASVGEANVTSNSDGGEGPPQTPYAFSNKKLTGKHKKKRDDNVKASGTGFTVVGNIYEDLEESIQNIEDAVNEISYTELKKDDKSGRHKVNRCLIEVYQKLKEVDKLLDLNLKLRNEYDLQGEMWPKASPKKVKMINGKLNSINRKVKKMYQ